MRLSVRLESRVSRSFRCLESTGAEAVGRRSIVAQSGVSTTTRLMTAPRSPSDDFGTKKGPAARPRLAIKMTASHPAAWGAGSISKSTPSLYAG